MHGAAKGLDRVGGIRMIDRVADALRGAADDLVLLANVPGAAEWLPGVAVVNDRRRGLGALCGVHAALATADADVLTVPWDMPFVPGGLLRALRSHGERSDADMVAPLSAASRWGFEPLCAWFSRTAIGPVEASLDAGDGRAGALTTRAKVHRLDVSSWGDPADLFFNVNSPADLTRANAMAARLTERPAP